MLHIIRTHSIFENVYIVEADTVDAAEQAVADSDSPADFLQKHISENILSTLPTSLPKARAMEMICGMGYF